MAAKPKSLRFLKNQITRIENISKRLEGVSVYSVKHYLDELEVFFNDFSVYYDSEDLTEVAEREYEEYDDRYQRAKALLMENMDTALQRRPGEVLNESALAEKSIAGLLERQNELFETLNKISNASESRGNRLPFLKIPVFKGELKEWIKFKNLYISIVHDNKSLSEVEKLNHLISLLDGEPLSLVRHFPIDAVNYRDAWGTLLREYDNDYLLVRCMIGEVMNFPSLDGKCGNLRNLWGILTETIQSLDHMSEYCTSRDPWIIFAVTSKFDRETAKKWAKHVVEEGEPSVTMLIEFMRELCSTEKIVGGSQRVSVSNTSNAVKRLDVSMYGCFVCGGPHKIFQCQKFSGLSVQDREKLVKSQSRCINCLNTGHFAPKCSHRGTCFHCRKKHHSLLHYEHVAKPTTQTLSKIQNNADSVKAQESGETDGLVRAHFAFESNNHSAILPTAIIEIRDGFGNFQKCRALLDCGAQASFMTECCQRKLNLARNRVRVPIQFVSGSNKFRSMGSVSSIFRSCVGQSSGSRLKLHVVQKLTDRLPEKMLRLHSTELLKRKFELADPDFDEPGNIDLIIGADHFFSLIGPRKYYHTRDDVWILESSIGWLISGGSSLSEDGVISVNSVSHSRGLDDILEKFWELEEPVGETSVSQEDAKCERLFAETTFRNDEGRYCVSLPFREPMVQLGDSFRGAFNRFLSLEKRFRGDPEFHRKYNELIDLFLREGYLERIPEHEVRETMSDCFYLPHYGIFQSGENSCKLRIVFDAAAKSDNGLCLNDSIMSGPKYQSNIFHLLLDFRRYRFVFTADIIKMYRQILINENQRDYQRILWRSSEDQPIQHFRLCTLMDGVNAAPYLALRTMYELGLNEAHRYPNGALALRKRYMDDFFVGHSELSGLITMREELVEILASAGMALDKWASNDDRILENVESRREYQTGVEIEPSQTIKTLGVIWNFKEDYFTFYYKRMRIENYTKRMLLSEAARVFDPCGWVSPVVVMLKTLFQKTWLNGIGWDDALPEGTKSDWLRIRNDLSALSNIKIPRFLGGVDSSEIHAFCDASLVAYAAVVYLRTIDETGSISTKIIASKTKLCPLKTVTVARLELCSAHLLAKLLNSMKPMFDEIKPSIFCWSDSKTVLAWLSSNPSRWKPFIANRCGQIHELLSGTPWRYVKSECNPADIATRGSLPSKLCENKLWWHGPRWLMDEWQLFFHHEVFGTQEEERTIRVATVVCDKPFFIRFVERFSDFRRFQRSFTYFVRFLDFLKNRKREDFSIRRIDVVDVNRCTELFIKLLQFQSFKDEVSMLRCSSEISRSSKLSSLSPFLDERGLLRVGGRLSDALISYGSKHPIILPHGYFVRLFIRHVHVRYYHAGLRLTMSLLKQNYYIPRMRAVVKSIISECTICVMMNGKTYQPTMSNLPVVRLDFNKPFEATGIDFAGPIMIRPYVGKGKITLKGYISVMVCLATKAVHLELVSNLSSEALIMSLKRFVSRYGRCNTIFSDNGRNFVGCARQLKELKVHIAKAVDSPELKSYLLENLITWKFIPPYTPHFGGIWEAAVKSAKFHLSRIFLGKTPTLEEMNTALAEISTILNSRPLSALSEDVEDFGVLTPSHLLLGYPAVHLPLLDDSIGCEVHGVERYRRIGSLVTLFWKRWKNEFYQDYLKRVKWKYPGKDVMIGDLVLIKRPSEMPTHWLRGRVVELYPGKDGVSRVVTVKTAEGERKESVRNLVPLLLKQDASTGGICSITTDKANE